MTPKMTREEFDKSVPELTDELKDTMWRLINAWPETGTSLDIVDWSFECSMCGKPMPYRFCGMCTHCEMVWNSQLTN